MTPNDTDTRETAPMRARRDRSSESGQTLVLFALFFTVILGFAALVLDQGLLRKANVDLYNALDSGALAGVSLLPDDPAGAEAMAREYVQLNFPGGLPSGDTSASFRCLVGIDAGQPRLTDIPYACDPGITTSSDWTCDGSTCSVPCEPSSGDVCNVIVMEAPAEVDYNFASVLGVFGGNTGDRVAAACKGLCGEPPEVPLDLVLIVDRTGSMNGVDTANARNAADSVRGILNQDLQWLAFGALGPSKIGQSCATQADTSLGGANYADLRRWIPVGLTGKGASFDVEYASGSSQMAKAMACFQNSSTKTDLTDPVKMATYELESFGRSNAHKAILLLSDGQPNTSTSGTRNYCEEANQAATDAKAKGIEVFTIGFGLNGSNDISCPDTSGAWRNRTATTLLASMATASANDNGCPGTENSDGDHYFCLPKTAGASTDLSDVFKQAVTALTSHSRLIKLP
jgi:Putative Flp pilus-assembly TadE/G-like/von Willebrand factor type A domain